jgi:predicted enzyme related to lactoylglutathione lyase
MTESDAADADLASLGADALREEVRRLRAGIRVHRDSTGHALCWHHPALWGLLPERTDPLPLVPDWPQFLEGCLRYRRSLDEQLPQAPRAALPPPDAMRARARTQFEHANPILRVRDLARSVRYYVDVLGFTNADWGGEDFTLVTRDTAGIYLCEGDQGNPGTWVWVGVEDVAALHEEYRRSGAAIVETPRNFPWAYEMKVVDPDNHVLRFGSEPRADIAVET